MQILSFTEHLPCTYQVPGILQTAGETVLIKIDNTAPVIEVEVDSENKQNNRYTNKIVSDCDKCQEDNRMG